MSQSSSPSKAQNPQQTTSQPKSGQDSMNGLAIGSEVADGTLDNGVIQRATARPGSMNPKDLMVLQRSIGNRAVQRLLDRQRGAPITTSPAPSVPIQASRQVGPVNDRYEREADRVAATITAPNKKNAETPTIQRWNKNHKLPQLQTKSAGGDGLMEAQPEVEDGIARARGGGQRLDEGVRSDMEQKFSADFSGVRVHTNTQADTLNRSLDARAFTTGQDIFFKQGEYQPASQDGQKLLAHELTHVRQQTGASTNAPIQRKSDKLPQRNVLEGRARANKFRALFGATTYTKVMRAIDVYHNTTSATDTMEQLQQLIRIHDLLVKWMINHGETTAKTGTNDTRSNVLHDVHSNFLPQETADVYAQAKTANVNFDVATLQKLLDIVQTSDRKGQIETDYATALRTSVATDQESTTSSGIITGQGSSFLSRIRGISSTPQTHHNLQNMDPNGTGGAISDTVLSAPIAQTDSENMKKWKKAYRKQHALKNSMGNMSLIEFQTIAAYTDEWGYDGMNRILRGGSVVRGNSKKERKKYVKERNEINHTNMMASSGLNRLPNWDGSPVYRGEGIGWAKGSIVQGATITFSSFTSTSASIKAAEMFAAKSGGWAAGAALWQIQGVSHQGKDISELTLQAKTDAFGGGTGTESTTEDEVLLKPYTRVYIDSVDEQPQFGEDGEKSGYKYLITATAQ